MFQLGGVGEGGPSNKDFIVIMLHPAEIEELGDPDQPLKLVRVERRCVEEVTTIITMRRSRIQRQIHTTRYTKTNTKQLTKTMTNTNTKTKTRSMKITKLTNRAFIGELLCVQCTWSRWGGDTYIHNIHKIHKMHKNYIYNDILIWTMAMVDIMAMECDHWIKDFDIQWN